jgi:hypothetical protein
LENVLAQDLLSGVFKAGDKIKVDVQNGELIFGA